MEKGIKSSGQTREFNTGSHRDMSTGKGRMDLIPCISVLKIYAVRTNTEENAGDMSVSYETYLQEAFLAAMRYTDGERSEDFLARAARAAVIATGIYESLNGGDQDGNKVDDITNINACLAFGLKQVSIHYEAGALKYGENNWKKGQPLSVLLDSGMRHNVKAIANITDEPHCRAAAWNYMSAIWTELNLPEMDNLPKMEERE